MTPWPHIQLSGKSYINENNKSPAHIIPINIAETLKIICSKVIKPRMLSHSTDLSKIENTMKFKHIAFKQISRDAHL